MPPQPHKHAFWEELFSQSLPRTHLVAAGFVALSLVVFLVLAPSKPVSAFREAPARQNSTAASPGGELISNLNAAIVEVSSRVDPNQDIQLDEEVRRGDNLSTIFQRMSLDNSMVHALANAGEFSKELRSLKPGEVISVVLTADDNIKEVIYERSKLESFRFMPTDDGFRGEKLSRDPDNVMVYRHVTIDQSLFQDGDEEGLSHAHMMQLANIFAWDIDFALDIRKGDSFSILYEDQYVEDERVGSGTILGAEFTNQGRTYKAVRFVDSNGDANYYSPEGKPMKKAFLRAPLDFTRVSSHFNPNRLHPIFKTRRPHRGVDYSAPTGTPVYSAGAGKVVASAFSPSSGNYVVVQHNGTYTTKYLHLNKRSVKVGQSVKQHQVIGAVGSTGYATGPHLHYEFLINGVHTNPQSAKMPIAEPIAKSEMASFRKQTSPLLAQFESLQAKTLASATSTPKTSL